MLNQVDRIRHSQTACLRAEKLYSFFYFGVYSPVNYTDNNKYYFWDLAMLTPDITQAWEVM